MPNARATEIELYQGLAASSVNAEPSLERDRLAINQRLARFLPAGFYYKTFMWPRRLWPRYEARIRAAAGLGSAPDARDAERYDKRYAHCDVLVLGGGPAGLAAADAAAATGARVILVDEQRELGGSLLSCPAEIDGEPALRWAGRIEAGLRQRPDVRILTRGTAFGYQDHNLVTVAQRLTDHLPVRMRAGSRELLWKIRAGRVILATGAHERPLVFGNNDLPGVMLASAVSAYIHRYGVLPGATRCCSPTTTEPIRRPSIWPIAAPGRRGGCPRPGRRHPAGRRPAPWRDRDGRRRRDGRARQAAGRVRRRARVCQGPVRRARRDLAMRSAGDVGRPEPGAAPARAIRRQAAVAGAQGLLRARQKRAGRGQRGAAAGEFDLCLALAQATRAGAEAASAAGFSVSTALPVPRRRPPPRTR